MSLAERVRCLRPVNHDLETADWQTVSALSIRCDRVHTMDATRDNKEAWELHCDGP
jgi:hypothetical protein